MLQPRDRPRSRGLKCSCSLHSSYTPLWVRRGESSAQSPGTHADGAAAILNTSIFGPHRQESLGGEFLMGDSVFQPVLTVLGS